NTMEDKDIIYDEDSPELTEDMFEKALIQQTAKTEIKLVLDSDLMEWYKKQNISYQNLINSLLRSYMEAHN
ncbi:MAG: BrnA antitoxin family protein, partial [Desulfamplus sp.]|nr:BrnA antitoxin family protein [Desulfamplus sp.]